MGLVAQCLAERRNRLYVIELAECPRGHDADIVISIAKGVGHYADRPEILELAEAEQADLPQAGVRNEQ